MHVEVLTSPVAVVVGLAALLTAVLGIAQSLGKIRKMWLRVEHVLTDLLGSPETDSTPEVLSLRALAKKTAADVQQVKATLPALATSHELDTLAEQVDAAQAMASDAAEAARQATTAGGLAVNEAKAARAIHTEAVAGLRGAVSEVAHTLTEEKTERRTKEAAYVAALNKIGVPLTPIIDQLEGANPT